MASIRLEPDTLVQPAEPTLARWLAAPAAICLLLFFLSLGGRELTSSHEARAAQNAQTMLDSGDWSLPRLYDGRVEMQKPPLFYWLVAALGWLRGGVVDGWCVRLPSALAASSCVFLLVLWGWQRGRPRAGMIAGMVLATALHFTALARIGRIDMPLTLCVALAVHALAPTGTIRPFLAALALAAGVMLKGPIALVLVATIGLVWLATIPPSQRRAAIDGYRALGWRTWLGAAGLLAVCTLPWFFWANSATHGEWFQVFFWYHNVDRGLGIEEKLRAYPLWFYGPQLARDFLPWSPLLPLALWHAWKRHDPHARFAAVWLLAITLLLSLMRFKRADYLLPAFPGAALLIGYWLDAALTRRRAVTFSAVVGAVVAGWLVWITLLGQALDDARGERAFAEVVRNHTGDQVLFFRVEAHHLAFQVGRPLATLLEWENLDIWAGRPGVTYVVMPREEYDCWREHIHAGSLEWVAKSQPRVPAGWASWIDTEARPYVLVRTRAGATSYNAP